MIKYTYRRQIAESRCGQSKHMPHEYHYLYTIDIWKQSWTRLSIRSRRDGRIVVMDVPDSFLDEETGEWVDNPAWGAESAPIRWNPSNGKLEPHISRFERFYLHLPGKRNRRKKLRLLLKRHAQ